MVGPDGAILEKPADAAAARGMLARLSGSTHAVWSGVVVLRRDAGAAGGVGGARAGEEVFSFAERTQVEFGALSQSLIDAYVASGEPLDKAGGYGVQGAAGCFVRGLRGDYYNVVGFPLHRFCLTMAGELGLDVPQQPQPSSSEGDDAAAAVADDFGGGGGGGGDTDAAWKGMMQRLDKDLGSIGDDVDTLNKRLLKLRRDAEAPVQPYAAGSRAPPPPAAAK